MADYQKMYLHLFHAVEDAIQLLIEAQRACEELYMNGEKEAEQKEEQ